MRQLAWKLWDFSSTFANIDFCLCCFIHQCFILNPHPQPPHHNHSPTPPAQGLQCPGWVYKSSTPKSWCDSLTLTYSLQWLLHCIRLHQSITSKRFFLSSPALKQEKIVQLWAARINHTAAYCFWLLCISKDLFTCKKMKHPSHLTCSSVKQLK